MLGVLLDEPEQAGRGRGPDPVRRRDPRARAGAARRRPGARADRRRAGAGGRGRAPRPRWSRPTRSPSPSPTPSRPRPTTPLRGRPRSDAGRRAEADPWGPPPDAESVFGSTAAGDDLPTRRRRGCGRLDHRVRGRVGRHPAAPAPAPSGPGRGRAAWADAPPPPPPPPPDFDAPGEAAPRRRDLRWPVGPGRAGAGRGRPKGTTPGWRSCDQDDDEKGERSRFGRRR